MSETEVNYARAFEELQAIVTEIELGQITVDILSEKVKRASELIAICKTKLSSTEEDVNKILKELEEWSVVTLQHEKCVLRVLRSNEFEEDVNEDAYTAQQFGARGVPFFVFNKESAVSGAQPVDVFEKILFGA